MTDRQIHPDDPRLTAYALGELDADECLQIERLLDESPEAQEAVDEILETAGLLYAELQPRVGEYPDESAAQSRSNAAAVSTSTVRIADTSRYAKPATHRRRGRSAVVAAVLVSVVAVVLFFALPAWQIQRSAGDVELASAEYAGNIWIFDGDSLDSQHAAEQRAATQLSAAEWEKLRLARSKFSSTQTEEGHEQRNVDLGWARTKLSWEDGNFPRRQESSGPVDPRIAASTPGQAGETYHYTQDSHTSERLAESAPADSPRLPAAVNHFTQQSGQQSGPRPPLSLGLVKESIQSNESRPNVEGQTVFGVRPGRSASMGDRHVDFEFVQPHLQLPRLHESNIPEHAGYQAGVFFRTEDAPRSLGADAYRRYAGGESYAPLVENEFQTSLEHPLSTFSIDVDTAAYANMRRFLSEGQLPPKNAVRIEELINYFSYETPQPPEDKPFAVALEVGDCPWSRRHRLVRIGLNGRIIPEDQRPPSNVVFLVDVSGSMKSHNKLPLVQTGLEMLVEQMTESDSIAIVTYASGTSVALEPTTGDQKQAILDVIRNLRAGGSTNGEGGIRLAYQKALQNHIAEGSNRVVLCTDGDFNVGVTDADQLVRMIRDHADEKNVFLSIFGFGMGNLKDDRLEQLADEGNGQYGYVDGYREARRVFVEEMSGTLHTIAKDVKIQIEFNPARVGAYRLIGYENRVMPAQDFNDDRKDAGDVGAGHSVTALYEIIPSDQMPAERTDDLKYQKATAQPTDTAQSTDGEQPADAEEAPADKFQNELLTFKLRYKLPDSNESTKVEFPLDDSAENDGQGSPDLRWSAAVAGFGMLLRDSKHKGSAYYDMILELAQSSRGNDPDDRRSEFIDLVRTARSLASP